MQGEGLKKLLVLILPIFISTSVLEINNIVSKSLASTIVETGVPVINYATKIQGFVTGIVVTSIITVIYPQMAKLVEEEAGEELAHVFGRSLSLMAALILPATVGVVAFHEEIVRLLFQGGAFSAEDVAVTGKVLLYYGLGFLAIGLREIGIRIFYSKKKAAVPVINSVYMVVINIALNIILGKIFGLKGLAMGTLIALWVGGVGMLLHLKKAMSTLGIGAYGKNMAKILLASVAMGLAAKFAEGLLLGRLSPNISLLMAMAVGAAVYALLALLMGFEELEAVKSFITKKKQR